jgi:hypothetical protein
MTFESEFLDFSADKLTQLMGRIEICANSLSNEQVWLRESESENAVGNLLLHLRGNVRQWILCGVGREPDDRQRDAEFAARLGDSAQELVANLRDTVNEAAVLIRALPSERLLDRMEVQGYQVTVLSAIYHVVEHFAGHTFQVIFATKRFTGKDLGFYRHLQGTQPRHEPVP